MLGYTLAQFRGYLEMSFERERRARRERFEDLAAATCDVKTMTAHLKKLNED